MTSKRVLFLLLGVVAISIAYSLLRQLPDPDPGNPYTVINTFPHDPEAFTQGLVFHDGRLYEGTGLRGQSSVRIVELETGEITKIRRLPPEYHGEGITIHGDRTIQVTWQSRVGFVYDMDSLEVLDNFSISTEGWGLTSDGASLILSDGTSTLRFLDPETFQETRTVEVRDDDEPVSLINELEYIDGVVYANIWNMDLIARIDPFSGSVLGWLELGGLRDHIEDDAVIDVLNGIAYDDETGHLFVTGKLWPLLFEIELTPIG
ncbi:MAG: glutaminyl-peptide cyclotransferase [Candidatus Bathyarchaeota archaeon]|nr:glutaminyl-peptide cyclotransferase [Candidatus Bathyarchaeota archaeon]